jgi:hypothetical protein
MWSLSKARESVWVPKSHIISTRVYWWEKFEIKNKKALEIFWKWMQSSNGANIFSISVLERKSNNT